MNVFISWSGERSRCLAEALRSWLRQVINALDPWISVADIDKGTRWRDEVAARLKVSEIGIICLTPENLRSEWLLFEAGALSKAIDSAYVCPVLIDLEPSDVSGPLAQFQATRATRDDIGKLLSTINAALGANARSDKELSEAFDVWWPKLEDQIKQLPPHAVAPQTHRADRDLLEEILTIARDLLRSPGRSPVATTSSLEKLGQDSFELSLRRALEALPGIYRAKVDAFFDHYRVSVDPDPSLAVVSKRFEFGWDDEPLNSTGERAVNHVVEYLAKLRTERAEDQRTHADDDTADMARFRAALLKELRRRKLDFSADTAEKCLIKDVAGQLSIRVSKSRLLDVADPHFEAVTRKVYQALFGRPPKLDIAESAPAQE